MAKSLVHTCYTKLDNPQPPVVRLRGIFSGLVRVGTNDVGLRLGNRGGRGRARTGGLLVANEALSQLSYTPICDSQSSKRVQPRQSSFGDSLRDATSQRNLDGARLHEDCRTPN